MDWLDAESEWFSPKRELTRLKRRAAARWPIVLGLALLLTAGALRRLSKPPSIFTARVMLRISESNLLRDQSPLVGKGLADYLLEAALRSEDLAELLERNKMYAGARKIGHVYAAGLFRDELVVNVYRNYFAVERGFSEGVRTARVSIRYSDDDPDRAMTIAREVAELMAATVAANRRQASLNLAVIGRLAASAAETRLEKLQARLVAGELELRLMSKAETKTEHAARRGVEVRGLRVAVDHQIVRLNKSRRQLELIELREAVVDQSLGVDFRIVDERPPAIRGGIRGPLLGMVGIALFFTVFPLVAIGIGAFDRRVHDSGDVERLGLPVLGQIAEKTDEDS